MRALFYLPVSVSCWLALALGAGCGRAKEVHLTIEAGDQVSDAQLAQIRVLQIAVLGDEPSAVSYGVTGELADRKTTWIYRSAIDGRLKFEVLARDVSGVLVASGTSQIVKTKGSPVSGKVVLGQGPPLPTKNRLGESCIVGVDTCSSGFCVDGVCCSSACDGGCNTCNGVTPGTCTLAVAGSNPHNGCTPDPSSPCTMDGACDGKGACRKASEGTVCAQQTCSLGMLVSTATCDGHGTCAPPEMRACTPYACNAAGNACATICTASSGCASAVACITGRCGQVGLGARCFATVECSAGSCVDGYCCNAACDGGCQSCKELGHEGTCTLTAAGVADPHGTCTDTGAASCGTNGECDGAGACEKYGAGTVCAAGACSGDGKAFSATAVCDGTGAACPAQSPVACGAYRCITDGGPGCAVSCGACTYNASAAPPYQSSCAEGTTCTNHCVDAAAAYTCDGA